ncbi:hypothetical protein TNCV_3973811 [Trichonephila clavipes]|nr:hypothetical protein TNCV_3973811 [Trichonephila clavipes]
MKMEPYYPYQQDESDLRLDVKADDGINSNPMYLGTYDPRNRNHYVPNDNYFSRKAKTSEDTFSNRGLEEIAFVERIMDINFCVRLRKSATETNEILKQVLFLELERRLQDHLFQSADEVKSTPQAELKDFAFRNVSMTCRSYGGESRRLPWTLNKTLPQPLHCYLRDAWPAAAFLLHKLPVFIFRIDDTITVCCYASFP